MIAIIAGNELEAKRFADGQMWKHDEWFYPKNYTDLLNRSNFHVLVIGTAGLNTPPDYFERVYKLARERGRMK